jgi:hypothetical protein
VPCIRAHVRHASHYLGLRLANHGAMRASQFELVFEFNGEWYACGTVSRYMPTTEMIGLILDILAFIGCTIAAMCSRTQTKIDPGTAPYTWHLCFLVLSYIPTGFRSARPGCVHGL